MVPGKDDRQICSHCSIMSLQPHLKAFSSLFFCWISSNFTFLGPRLFIIHFLHSMFVFSSLKESLLWHLITSSISISTKETLLPVSGSRLTWLTAYVLPSLYRQASQKNPVSCFTVIRFSTAVIWLPLSIFMDTSFVKITYDYSVLIPSGHFQVFILFDFPEIVLFISTPPV